MVQALGVGLPNSLSSLNMSALNAKCGFTNSLLPGNGSGAPTSHLHPTACRPAAPFFPMPGAQWTHGVQRRQRSSPAAADADAVRPALAWVAMVATSGALEVF